MTDEPKGYVQCHLDGGVEEAEANVRLIAAAPDLLEAGKSALAWCEQGGPLDWSLIVVFRDLLRAAIAKAEGRETPVGG